MVESFPPPLSPGGETPTKRCFLTDRQGEEKRGADKEQKKRVGGKGPAAKFGRAKHFGFPKRYFSLTFFPVVAQKSKKLMNNYPFSFHFCVNYGLPNKKIQCMQKRSKKVPL